MMFGSLTYMFDTSNPKVEGMTQRRKGTRMVDGLLLSRWIVRQTNEWMWVSRYIQGTDWRERERERESFYRLLRGVDDSCR